MENIAELIAKQLRGACYEKELSWDAVRKIANCDVVAEFTNPEEERCPWELEDGVEPSFERRTGSNGDDTIMSCPLPRIPSEQYCRQNESTPSGLGWFYCINDRNEDNEAACRDQIDNDGDGLVDCEDPQCMACENACAEENDNPAAEGRCDGDCKYNITVTAEAEPLLVGAAVQVQCLQQFSFEDGNCQEDTNAVCTDGQDNDGNGVWDCSNDDEGEDAHKADPHCCPMTKGEGNACVLEDADGDGEPDYRQICDTSDYPDACTKAAEELGCMLP